MIRASEAECQAAIVEAALLAGWWVHGERASLQRSGAWSTAIQGQAGFPDLVLVRPPRLLFVELKRRPNRLEPAQLEWIAVLGACGLDVRVVWVPEQQDEFVAELVAR